MEPKKIRLPNSYYESPCYGHQCEKYQQANTLKMEVEKIYQEWDKTRQSVFPFIKFLRKLEILPSTLEHWVTCRPANIRIMEQVKLMCDETMVDCISDNPRLLFEYLRLTQPPTPKVVTDIKEERRADPLILGEDKEFSTGEGDK